MSESYFKITAFSDASCTIPKGAAIVFNPIEIVPTIRQKNYYVDTDLFFDTEAVADKDTKKPQRKYIGKAALLLEIELKIAYSDDKNPELYYNQLLDYFCRQQDKPYLYPYLKLEWIPLKYVLHPWVITDVNNTVFILPKNLFKAEYENDYIKLFFGFKLLENLSDVKF